MQRLDGTSFDIDTPGVYTYLKLPETGEDFEVTAVVGRNPAQPDKVYNKAFKFTGNLVGETLKVDSDGIFRNDVFLDIDELFERSPSVQLSETASLSAVVCDFSDGAERTQFCERQRRARNHLAKLQRKERLLQLRLPGITVAVQFAKDHVDFDFEVIDQSIRMGGLLASTVQIRKSTPLLAGSWSVDVI